MAVEITIPSPGESISEVTLGPWHKSDGDWVEKDETLVELESDKTTLELPSPESGVLKITAQEGDDKNVGDVIGTIDPDAEKPDESDEGDEEEEAEERDEKEGEEEAEEQGEEKSKKSKESKREAASGKSEDKEKSEKKSGTTTAAPAGGNERSNGQAKVTSLAKKIAEERGVDLARVKGTGPAGRITKSDVMNFKSDDSGEKKSEDGKRETGTTSAPGAGDERGVKREKMTKLRRRIAQRLVEAQHNAAMLTTFNECDMSAVMALRKKHKEAFAEKHGVGLGFMSFFTKACASALQAYPRVNAYIVGNEIEFHDYIDISVAVGTDKGLVVPVMRSVEQMSFADIEKSLKELATKARDGKLTIDEMTGGTFTISNGGVYGSLNSTPILNPPQSGILGMHTIKNRPVEDPDNPGQIVLRPMMYLAMSYDHRIIDGAEAVGFLVHVKECIEDPERLLLGV